MAAFGIDLGTSNIKIYNSGTDKILNQKHIVAIANRNQLFSLGNEAFEAYEKAPANIKVSFPMSYGVIADFNNMQTILQVFIEHCAKGNVRGSDYYIAVPTDITDVEKRAFFDLVESSSLRARRVYLIEKALADGLGVGLDIRSSKGTMMVNMGADTTEISIINLGGIVLSKLLKTGGNKFDNAIQTNIRREYNLVIGNKTSEMIKKQLAYATEPDEGSGFVYGRDIVTGLPAEQQVSSDFIYDAIKEHVHTIIDNIRVILERTPPELAADIIRDGIYLTGGSSNIRNIPELITRETKLKVNTFDSPAESVARGLARLIREGQYRGLAYINTRR